VRVRLEGVQLRLELLSQSGDNSLRESVLAGPNLVGLVFSGLPALEVLLDVFSESALGLLQNELIHFPEQLGDAELLQFELLTVAG